MKTKNLIKYLMVAATVGIVLACRKNKDDIIDKDTSSASDNALAEATYNDVHNIADEASKGSLTSFMTTNNSSDEKSLLSSCAIITIDTISGSNHTITINFGSTNCTCADGRNRRGIINVAFVGHYRDSASVHTITFTNYFVDDNQVMGNKTVTNSGHNSSGHSVFSIHVNGQIIKANGGGTVTWTSDRTREWIAGESTPTWGDDVYLISGSASGTGAAGNSFSAVITNPLRKEIGCHHIVSGTLEITPSGKATRIIDFGNGACDNQATVTINGNV